MRAKPNILLFQVDQLAAQWLPAYGFAAGKAPEIDALAGEGVVFDSAYCNSPLCSPSRFSMMTGCLPSRIGAYDNAADFPSGVPTFAHHLRIAGYHTILSGKMHFCGADQLHGFEERLTTDIYPSDFEWVPDWERPAIRPSWYHNMINVKTAGPAVRSNQLDFDEEVVFAARRKLFDIARDDERRPFLMTVSLSHPHDPYVMLPELWDLWCDEDVPMPSLRKGDVADDPHSARLRYVCDTDDPAVTDAHVRAARHGYVASIAFVDRQLGLLRRTLRDCGLDRETVIVLTSDHGDLLGERGLWFKMSWLDGSARVPLIVHWPERFRPTRVAAACSLIDLLPTFLDLAGGEPAEAIDGRTLLPPMDGGSGHDEAIGEYMAEGTTAPLVMIRRSGLKFTSCPTDPEQLFDLASDPQETHDLAADPANAGTVATFRADVERRWDLARLRDAVIRSQRQRRIVQRAHRLGHYPAWDFQPFTDATRSYVRTTLDLDDLDAKARLPRPR